MAGGKEIIPDYAGIPRVIMLDKESGMMRTVVLKCPPR